jgi:electron transfer flavoprotein beta subunit
MRIVVCVKQVPDPEAPFSMFKVDEVAKRVVPVPGLAMVMSPFDAQAVEAALRIREQGAEVKITVVTLGPDAARSVIKHGLAMGADEGVLICDSDLPTRDSHVVTHALVAAMRKMGGCDLVLAGRQAADRDAGIVGAGIAELLKMPLVSYARDIRCVEGKLRVERIVDDGSETVELELPAVVTVSNELGAPRAPNLRETMRAARKPVVLWSMNELGLSAETTRARTRVERIYAPVKDNRCEFVHGSVQEQAVALARHLRETHVL